MNKLKGGYCCAQHQLTALVPVRMGQHSHPPPPSGPFGHYVITGGGGGGGDLFGATVVVAVDNEELTSQLKSRSG